MASESTLPPITVLGDRSEGGTYVLRIRLRRALALVFGRFKGGKAISLPAGEYLYVGSALGRRGATALARRLVRHATRSGDKPPHKIRERLIARFTAIGLGSGDLLPKREKRLHWHVDYLLVQPSADLTHVIAIRSNVRLEPMIGRVLEEDPCTSIVEKGLGASDVHGNTHLLRVLGDEGWWRSLPERLQRLL